MYKAIAVTNNADVYDTTKLTQKTYISNKLSLSPSVFESFGIIVGRVFY